MSAGTTNEAKLQRLRNGERLIVSDAFLEWCIEQGIDDFPRSAFNRNRLGVHDAYVAWISEDATPSDLEFNPDTMRAYASA